MSDLEEFDFNAEQEDTELSEDEQVDSEFEEESEEVEEEESQEEDTHSDDDDREAKTAKHYQSLADKRLAEIEAERKRAEELQRELEELRNKGTEKEPEEELRPPEKPVKPRNYNKTDALTDPESESALYDQEYQEYLDQKLEYTNAIITRQQEYQRKQQMEVVEKQQREQHKSKYINGFKQAGLSQDEAEDWYSFLVSQDSLDPVKLIERIKNSAPKKSDFKNKKELSEMTPPPGIESGKTPKRKLSDDDAFFEETFG